MAKYLLTYHGGGMPESEEETARVMAAWNKWYEGLSAAVADPGNPVGAARTVAPDGSVRDGGGTNPVSGYTIIEAASLDVAVAMSRGCPIIAGGGSIEVCETFNVM